MTLKPEPPSPEPTKFTVVMPPLPPGAVVRIPSLWIRGGNPLPVPIFETDESDTPIIVGPK